MNLRKFKLMTPIKPTKKVNKKELLAAIKSMQDNSIYITFLENQQILINDNKFSLIMKDLGSK